MQAGATSHAMAARRIPARDLAIFALVAFSLAALTRIPALPLSVIDWDESAYLLISRDILDGVWPYQGGFDHKPVGIYYIFALAQLLFGTGVPAIRLLAIVAVGLTAFLIAIFLRRSTAADTLTAASAGALYALLSTINGGLATNTEILLNAYAVAALILFNGDGMTRRFAPRQAAFVGIVLALMLQTNYLAGVLMAGLSAAYAFAAWRINGVGRAVLLCLTNGAAAVAALLATSAVLLLPIVLWSDIGDYFARQTDYIDHYYVRHDTVELLRRAFRGLIVYAPLLALAATLFLLARLSAGFRRAASAQDAIVADQSFIYLAFAMLACLASGHLYPHYFILALPSLCIAAGLFLNRVPTGNALRPACAVWLLLLSGASLALEREEFRPGLHGTLKWMAGEPPDVPAAIARDLRDRLEPEDHVYVYDYEIILYELLDRPLPLQYFFPTHHLHTRYGMDRATVMELIMAQAPRFVIAGRDPASGIHDVAAERLKRALDRHYTLLEDYPHPGRSIIRVYERRAAVVGERRRR